MKHTLFFFCSLLAIATATAQFTSDKAIKITAQMQVPDTTFKMASYPIRQAIRQGNTKEALTLLLRTGTGESALLLEKFSEGEQQRALGLIGIEEWSRIQMQICYVILDLHWMKDPHAQAVVITNKSQILQLLRQRQTEQALALCAGTGDEYILLQTRLNLARKQSEMGPLESEYWEMTKNRINSVLQEMLEELPESKPQKKHWFSSIRRLFK